MENDVETTSPFVPPVAEDPSAVEKSTVADSEHVSATENMAAEPQSPDQADTGVEDADPGEGSPEPATPAPDESSPKASRRSGSSSKADLEREGEVAADFLETLMDIADLDGDLEVDVDGDRAAVSIVDSEEGSVPRRLVGTKANVLEALQELTRLAVQAETGERSRLMLDVGGYRANRRTELIDSAAGVIAAVKGGEPRREMEPMSAFERKVVHDEVLRAGLRSESEGEEPRRFVVVLPA